MDLVNEKGQTPRDLATGDAATYLQSVVEERLLKANTAQAKARYVEADWTPADNWASAELQEKIKTAEQEHIPTARPRAMRL